MSHSSKLYSISFVIIGLNEEKMISRCIESMFDLDYHQDKIEIIYVDSGSTDRTLEIASKYPIKIVQLRTDRPNSALGRNEGLKVSKGELVHFIGGDSVIDSQWLKNALPYLADDEIACITGRMRELFPERSVYNKLMDLTFQSFPSEYVGIPPIGGGLIKKAILDEVGLFDVDLTVGEASDYFWRINRRGYKILNISALMSYHDINILSLFEYLKRGVRNGYGTAQYLRKYLNSAEKSKWFFSSVIMSDIQVILFFMMVLSFFLRSFLIGYILSLFVGIFILRKIIKTYRLSKNLRISFLSPFMLFLSRCAVFIGYVKYFIFKGRVPI